MTIQLTVDPVHVQALTQAAARSKLTITGYLSEVVEAHAATLLLPNIGSSGGKAGGIVRDERSEEGNVQTYRLHL